MPRPFSTFAESAKTLSRNPLGIIALFIVLIYAMASLVLGVAASHLQPYERAPLVYFLILFPLAVLWVFAWLVTRHHEKLYAPSDFKDEANFIRTLTPAEQRSRINEEVQVFVEQSEPPAVSGQELPSDPGLTSEKSIVTPSKKAAAFASVFLAEDLVLRDLQAEYGPALYRNILLSGTDERVELDGLISQPDTTTAVEIKLLPSTNVLRRRLREVRTLADKTMSVLRSVGDTRSFKLLLAMVTNAPPEELAALRDQIAAQLVSDPRIIVRVYSFDELKSRFGGDFSV